MSGENKTVVTYHNLVNLPVGLTLLLAAGKIFGFLPTWTWFGVFVPIWGPVAVVAVVGFVSLGLMLLFGLVEDVRRGK